MQDQDSSVAVETDLGSRGVVPEVEAGPAAHLATTVSQVLSPPVLVIVAVQVAAALHDGDGAHRFAAVHALAMVGMPLAFLLLFLRRGQVSDVDVYHRDERWRPFLAAVTGGWIGWGALEALGAPRDMIGVAGVLALEATVIFVVTLGWKISLHCATLAVTGAVVWKLTGSPVPLLIGIPLMIWSRLRLRRHTPAQTIAGTLVGILLVYLFFELFAGTV